MPHTQHAIILAAGFGSRLQAQEGHKLLAVVGGRNLLAWHLDHFTSLGVTHVTVVTGFRHEALERAVLEASLDADLQVHTAYNPKFDGSNGLSVLAGVERARAQFPEQTYPFWLTMADHVFDPKLGAHILEVFDPAPNTQGALFVDAKLDSIYDMPDATKVLTREGILQDIGKEIEAFNLVDVGLFWCTPGFVEALDDALAQRGDCSTSDAVTSLSALGAFEFPDIGEHLWQDVDTPGARAHAEKLMTSWKQSR